MSHASPRHRAVTHHQRRRQSSRALAVTAVIGVLLTGGAVSAQALLGGAADQAAAASVPSSVVEAPVATNRTDTVSRGHERAPIDASAAADLLEKAGEEKAAQAEAAEKKAEAEKKKAAALEDARSDPRGVAQQMLADHGWDAAQFSCLDALWIGESNWDYRATNPSSGAYGIPQSLPASKMSTAGDDWQDNPVTQITWGLDYIEAAYGTPCSANAFKRGNGWY